jgi:carbonic anhydrase/acetyltransferase-like protein (isoleucine patch superfamily)
LKAIGNIPQGLVGGWIGSEANLCTLSPAWVFADSFVYEKAHVSGMSRIYSGSAVRGHATVSEKARINGQCLIEGNARILGNANLMDIHATEGEWTGKHFGNRN